MIEIPEPNLSQAQLNRRLTINDQIANSRNGRASKQSQVIQP